MLDKRLVRKLMYIYTKNSSFRFCLNLNYFLTSEKHDNDGKNAAELERAKIFRER